MEREFKKIAENYAGAERFKSFDMTGHTAGVDYDQVSTEIIQSIRVQLEKTNAYLENTNKTKVKDRCIKDDDKPNNILYYLV